MIIRAKTIFIATIQTKSKTSRDSPHERENWLASASCSSHAEVQSLSFSEANSYASWKVT